MQHPGFEFYAGAGESVRDACRADRLEALRAGELTRFLVHFPPSFLAGDVLLLETAVAAVTGACPPLAIDRVEALPGLFVDQIARSWVHSVASVGRDCAAILFAQWCAAYRRQEGRVPDWSLEDHTALVAQLIDLCREAIDEDLDVLMVWLL